MAHFENHIHETFGVADPATERPTWEQRLPAILDGLRDQKTVMPAVALLVEMARAADAKEKSPEE
jgi:hypothetical protein